MSRYASLSREQLAIVVPELLLIGQLIDRSGMAWCIEAFGREQMAQVAIEEWSGASPVYTGRMQQALGFEGDDVPTIFKGLQLDIGAPPQFMDIRFTVDDAQHGSFVLAHCGALMDVEPMGEDYVRSMCHDIEDPTFDATAVATNPKAQVRPVHRPPRTPKERTPHCEWTVSIEAEHPEVSALPAYFEIAKTQAAGLELKAIDPSDEGESDYSGPLKSDLDFAAFSHAALVRIADEVCLQMHLLNLSFVLAVSQRADVEHTREIALKQLTGWAGIAAERIHRCLGLPADASGALEVLRLHPILNPQEYVEMVAYGSTFTLKPSLAHKDGAWISLCGPDETRPLQAIVRAVDPHLDVAISGGETWTLRVTRNEHPAKEAGEVAVTRFSTGSNFVFTDRESLPIWPV